MNRLMLLAAAAALCGAAYAAEPVAGTVELTLVDMQGQKKVLGTLPDSVFSPRVSPDGRRVAFELAEPPTPPDTTPGMRLQVAELGQPDKARALPLTLITKRNMAPVWSPDGDWVVFMASGNGGDTLYWQRVNGSMQPLYLADGRAVEGWYEGGKIVFLTRTGDGDYGISMLDADTRKATRLVDLPGSSQHSSRISPDGKWLAYASDETGRYEIWLEPLPVNGRRFQLTRSGGGHPQWSPDGTKLYYDQGGRMFRLELTLGETPRAGEPQELPISGFVQGGLRRQYDLMPDGSGFVMLFPKAAAQ